MSYLWGCKATLVAFIWLFSGVSFQMCSQSACMRGCKVTLVACVRLFSTVLSNVFLNCLPVDLHFMTFCISWHLKFYNIWYFLTFCISWYLWYLTFCDIKQCVTFDISWHLAFHDIWHFIWALPDHLDLFQNSIYRMGLSPFDSVIWTPYGANHIWI